MKVSGMPRNLDEQIKQQKFFTDKIKNKEPFCLLRFNDGELKIIFERMRIDQREYGGFLFTPGNDIDKIISAQLYVALVYKGEDYYIYIPYKRINLKKEPYFETARALIRQDLKYILDYDDIWGGSGEITAMFLDKIFDLINNNKFNLICNERIDKIDLKLKFNNIIKIKVDCWRVQYKQVVRDFLDLVLKSNNEVFLIAAGAFSEILIFYAWQLNKHNIYIDIGSLFDPFFIGKTRGYYRHPDVEQVYRERQKAFGEKK